MKEYLATLIFHGLVLMLAVRTASSHPHPLYGLASFVQEDPFGQPGRQEHPNSKRGFWEKRSSEEVGDVEGFESYPVPQLQWTKRNFHEKKGFGTMMPAFLVNLYRPDVSALPQNSPFSPPRGSTMREKRSNSQ
ncbi:uncharacterized protein LOC135200774 isoform X2 [Macrobrachium nipponense]|uniref:uncharacterized protein LOC135200774 isoform X2 n=1 Tax=Macrobrachium nipponense TaxID=159736 RepID=UPI0030C7E9CE